MQKVHVILDSTAYVPEGMLEKYDNLHIVPLYVTLGQRQWREDQLTSGYLFSLVKTLGEFPKTSQPAPGDFIRAYQPIIGSDCEIVVITISSGLSGTLQSARTAAQSVDPKRIFVVDSGTTAIGMTKMAELALSLAEEGKSAKAIAQELEAISQSTYTYFVPGTLEYLHKGGRIGGASALLGTMLQIRPVLYLNAGKVSVLDKVRTRNKALSRMLQEVKQHNSVYIGVVHIEAPDEAEGLRQQLLEFFPAELVSVSTGGAVLAAHLGPGLTGIVLQDGGR